MNADGVSHIFSPDPVTFLPDSAERRFEQSWGVTPDFHTVWRASKRSTPTYIVVSSMYPVVPFAHMVVAPDLSQVPCSPTPLPAVLHRDGSCLADGAGGMRKGDRVANGAGGLREGVRVAISEFEAWRRRVIGVRLNFSDCSNGTDSSIVTELHLGEYAS